MIQWITPEELIDWWPHAAPYLNKALPYSNGRYSIDYIYQGITDCELQLWVGEKFAGVTEVAEYPGYKACIMFLCAGDDVHEWKEAKNVIEHWAKEIGCKKTEIWGRKGWLKVLPDYQEEMSILSKEL